MTVNVTKYVYRTVNSCYIIVIIVIIIATIVINNNIIIAVRGANIADDYVRRVSSGKQEKLSITATTAATIISERVKAADVARPIADFATIKSHIVVIVIL